MSLQETQESVDYFIREYATLKERYSRLPSVDELDQELNILEVVGRTRLFPRHVVRFVRWQMMEVVNAWAGYLHGFILPNPQNAASMEEYNHFTDKEKQTIIEMLNWIMYSTREMNLLQLDEDDDRTAQFIITAFSEWKERKKILRSVIDKNTASWKRQI